MNIENITKQKSAEECIEKMRKGIILYDDKALLSLRELKDIGGNLITFVYKEYWDTGYVGMTQIDKWVKETNKELPYLPLSLDEAEAALDGGHAVYDGTQILTAVWMRRTKSEPETRWVLAKYEETGSCSLVCELSRFKDLYKDSKDLRRWPDNQE